MAWSVSELTWRVKSTLESSFPNVEVEGEVTDLRKPSSGHLYFTLKDADSQVRAIVWRSTAARLKFKIENGMALTCIGDVEVYAARGSYSLVIRKAMPQGVGDLQQAFLRLREKLAAEGLFDAARKQALPTFARRLAFVTSPGGAAIHDFLQVAARRSAATQIVLVPAQVQGEGAAESICQGIAAAHRMQPPLDAIVVGRGGGSLEDLWCFNEERVVRTIAAATLPVVSAVGHEIDVTLADLAADRRALTPSEAAELLVPSAEELAESLTALAERLARPLRYRLQQHRQTLQLLASRPIFTRPHDRVVQLRQQVDELDLQARRGIERAIEQGQQQMERASARLEALSPVRVLKRGYSVTTHDDSDQAITDAAQVQPGDLLRTRLAGGQVTSRVTATESDRDLTR